MNIILSLFFLGALALLVFGFFLSTFLARNNSLVFFFCSRTHRLTLNFIRDCTFFFDDDESFQLDVSRGFESKAEEDRLFEVEEYRREGGTETECTFDFISFKFVLYEFCFFTFGFTVR